MGKSGGGIFSSTCTPPAAILSYCMCARRAFACGVLNSPTSLFNVSFSWSVSVFLLAIVTANSTT